MRRLAGLALFLLLLCAPAGAATLTTNIESTTLELGDSVTLIISLSGGDSSQPPDLSGLSKDFDILDRRRGSRAVLEDGKRTMVNDWVLTLAPKRAGTLTIPAFTLAGASTKPIRIDVTAPEKPAKEETRTIFVQTELGKGTVYAQGEIPVYVRVYDSLGMRSGAISQIRAEGASFREDGQQEVYSRTIGKTRYHVIQQTYIMTPQRSGTIEIDPVTLTANVPMLYNIPPSQMPRQFGGPNAPAPWLDGSLMRGQELKLHSEKLTVQVQPRPAGAQGWFLPARAVTVSEAWSSPPVKARVGVPLTRTITIDAVGASPNQMPPLDIGEVDGLRQYQEDRDAQNATIERQAGATLRQVVSVIPSRAGTFTLPAVTVGWWNTDRKTQEQAILPAVTLTVAPAPGVAAPPSAPAASPGDSGATRVEATAPPPDPAPGALSRLTAWALGLVAGLGAVGLFSGSAMLALAAGLALLAAVVLGPRLLRGRMARTRRMPPLRGLSFTPAPAGSQAEGERALTRAAKANDAAGTHSAYLALSRLTAGSLVELKPRTAEFDLALKELRAHLYGAPGGRWEGRRFLSAWRKEASVHRKQRAVSGPAGLRALYPGP